MTECRVCLGPHERTIHAATLRVHTWFRKQVTLSLRAPKVATARDVDAPVKPFQSLVSRRWQVGRGFVGGEKAPTSAEERIS